MSQSTQIDPAGRLRIVPVRVPINTAVSDPINLRGFTPKALLTPGALTSTSVQFTAGVDQPPAMQGREDQVQYKTVVDDAAAAVSITVAADRYILFSEVLQVKFLGLQYVRLLFNQTEVAERNMFLICGAALQ